MVIREDPGKMKSIREVGRDLGLIHDVNKTEGGDADLGIHMKGV
jgi:hypothetical protein